MVKKKFGAVGCLATVSTQPKMDADIYLADSVKTNLVTKFAVIWVKNGQTTVFFAPDLLKITQGKEKARRKRKSAEEERRKKRKKKNDGYNLGFYNGYFDGRGLFGGNIFKYKAYLSLEALK